MPKPKPWIAYIIYADLGTLVRAWAQLRDLFADWTSQSLPFSYNGYGEGLHPHLSIRVAERRMDLEAKLRELENYFPFSLAQQDYDEAEDIRWAYVLGAWLATQAYKYKQSLPAITIPRKHVVHGFVNSLGFFDAGQEKALYNDLLESLDRTLKNA